MDLSIDNYHSSRIVKPVWSTTHKFSQPAQLNMWPIRQRNHCKRFYGNSKLRPVTHVNHQAPPFNGGPQENFPMSIKFDIETFDKHKSYTSMAFCSTSKVKYMPLAGSSLDSFGALKLGTPHSTIFPTLSRPVSRPVLIHGKRYTVATSEPIRSNTAFSQSDHEDSSIFRQDQMITDQRRRFNEIEQHKSNIRYRGTGSEGNDFTSRKSYCLSGRRIRIMETKISLGERVPRLQPTLNINNHPESSDKYQEENQIEALSDRLHVTDLEDKQISQYNNANSVITIDIVDKTDKPTQLNAQETLQSIKKIVLFCKTFSLDDQALDQSKNWVNDFVSEIHSEYYLSDPESNDISNNIDLDSFWTLIQQAQENTDISNSMESLLSQELFDFKHLLPNPDAFPIDASTFINLFSAQEKRVTKYFWSKILQDLQIEHLTESILASLMLTKISIHPRNYESKEDEENLAITKLYFWIHLMKMFSMKPDIKLEDWIKISIIILINKFAISEDLENEFLEKIEMFISTHFTGDHSSLNLSDYLLSIRWMLEVHEKLFGRLFSMEQIAMIRCMIENVHYE